MTTKPEHAETDFCSECNRETHWTGEVCQGCGRTWGYDLGKGPDTCPRHGGPWGDDETCVHCTYLDGNPRPQPEG